MTDDRRQKSDLRPLTSDLRPPTSERGVALIITVILLSALTLMILAFLTMSRQERGAVTTSTDTASARLAADAALANAEAQIVANALATTNPYNFGLIVSTNYINQAGFDPTVGVYNPANVNYDYLTSASGGGPLNQSQLLQNLANLYYSPRPPVFIGNNFRFYLDLNRNGVDDPNGMMPETNNAGLPTGTNYFEVGDPEWIGVLQRPDQPYGPNNPFVARFAFIALPIGNALDLNAIHNQTLNLPLNSANDGYFRNQGVGSWEINLAAFLADLNTNKWGQIIGGAAWYQYNPPPAVGGNKGVAFEDAFAVLTNRYAGNYSTLAPVGGNPPPGLFTNSNVFPPFQGNIDAYSDWTPPMTTPAGINVSGQNVVLPWAGADNTNHFFTHQELFDPTKTSVNFTNHLWSAGTNVSTYDRYTFYRLLSQLGTDSTPEQNKMNLNYSNAVTYVDPANGIVTNIAIIPNAETNFTAWTPSNFFIIAADKMLRAYSQEWLVSNPSNYVATFSMTTNIGTVPNPTNIPVPFGIADIPVLVSNRFVYTPAVQRVLQLAANIYDATTNNTLTLVTNFPSVFRPTFWVTNENGYTDVYINGYEQVVSVTGTADVQLALPVDITSLPLGLSVVNYYPNGVNVYGVPWIIGAKKGFPNFNEFSMESIVQITRKLEITRPNLTALPSACHTNQMYIMSISNVFGVECWNSYSSNYSNPVLIWPRDTISMTLTNDAGMTPPIPFTFTSLLTANIINVPAQWPGTSQPWSTNSNPNFPSTNSFVIPLFTNVVLFTNLTYVYSTHQFEDTTNYLDLDIQPLPHFGLLTTNRLQVVMLGQDSSGNYHVIDYVHFAGPDSHRDLNAEIADVDANGLGLWNTNLLDGVPNGVNNQINYSDNPIQNRASTLTGNDDGAWATPPGGGTVADAIASFDSFLNEVFAGDLKGLGTNPDKPSEQSVTTNTSLFVQVPFTPTRTVFEYITWQANDPLVHYMGSDLNYSGDDYGIQTGTNKLHTAVLPILPDLGQLNMRYMPWGGYPPTGFDVLGPYNLAGEDPLIYSSDDWDFPTNKLPTIGWLGRVHRGTPWQTVYMKSPAVGPDTWEHWTGDFISSGFDATNSMPKQDWLLFDLFTTTFNNNATRGQLSVNVGATNGPSLAAWSALFSGVIVLSNNAGSVPNRSLYFPRPMLQMANSPIDPAGPAGTNAALGKIVAGINQVRTGFMNVDGLVGAFEHVGDVLATPALTVNSPFLNWSDAAQRQNGISDEMYEWLPQQVMSLLRVGGSPQTPMRYVIYSYGQALKPAPDSLVTSGNFFGMCTNYQIVSEAATRAVVRFGSTLTNVVGVNTVSGTLTVTNQLINNNAVIERFNVLPPD